MKKFEEIIVTYHSDDIIPYPEYKGKPYFSIKYEENGEHYVGYGTYNPQVLSNYIKDYFNDRASMVEEFEKLEAEFEEEIEYFDYDCNCLILPARQVYDTIDNRIKELKGE